MPPPPLPFKPLNVTAILYSNPQQSFIAWLFNSIFQSKNYNLRFLMDGTNFNIDPMF